MIGNCATEPRYALSIRTILITCVSQQTHICLLAWTVHAAITSLVLKGKKSNPGREIYRRASSTLPISAAKVIMNCAPYGQKHPAEITAVRALIYVVLFVSSHIQQYVLPSNHGNQ